ncbi:hypothetical protein JQ581_30025 [Bradyrhizobium liaoningense]|uniref:hypothetical protein n=1 Tax=Bradyrhizobium liaoningense TaxID=43992 RepID=UPI001BA8732D|nr:hypothetical protein [Bradyrhizobium liaoningense]MBR0741178.1 hypothetical protein [Bradyrhizobium liaoningense]
MIRVEQAAVPSVAKLVMREALRDTLHIRYPSRFASLRSGRRDVLESGPGLEVRPVA